jgi:methylphosphotriester-DNA--protein-cysteine methyltransferase
MSLRTLQRRFLLSTGLTYKAMQQIERARKAATLLEQGVPIIDAAYETGFFDQSHLTNSLKRFIGQTPAQIAQLNKPE